MAIELVPLATATATLAPPIMLPNTPAGTRVIFEILDYRWERRDVRGLRAPLTRQQRGPDDAGRVAEPVRYDRRPELVVEDVARDRGAPAVVQRLQLREPATEHHDVGIEDVDHVRERTAEAVEVPVD